jgi:spore maturation protein SpmB
MRSVGKHSATTSIVAHAATTVVAASAANDRELDTLKTHKTLANVVISRRVDSAALSITKELVQGIIRSALSNLVRIVVKLLCLVDGIVNWSIGRILGRAAVKTSRSSSRVLLTVAVVGAHLAITGIVSTRCSGKRLQVSDHWCPS